MVPADYLSGYVFAKFIFGKEKKIIGSLASNLRVLDYDFEYIFAAGKLSKVRYCYKKMGVRLETHRDHSITCIDFYRAFTSLKWSHLPRH